MTYELINRRTTNTLADFSTEDEAFAAYEQVQAEDAQLAHELVIVEFDDAGEAVGIHAPSELSAA